MGKISQLRLFIKRQDGVSKQELDVLGGSRPQRYDRDHKKSISSFAKNCRRKMKKQ